MTGIGKKLDMDMYGEYSRTERTTFLLQGIERVKICFDVGALSRQVVMAGDL